MTATPLLINNFELQYVKIALHNGKTVGLDVKSVMALEYSEGMMQKYVTVTMKIVDTTNTISQALYGLEKVEFVMKDLINDVKYEFTNASANGPLYIYEVHDKQIIDTAKVFVIELCSYDGIVNNTNRIGKKYTAIESSALAGDVLAQFIKTKKPLNSTKSVNKLTFIPPNAKPYDVLVWARNKYIANDQKSTKSGGKYHSAGYFFYEDYNQYNFVSIDSLAASKKPRATYTTGTGLSGVDEYFRMNNPKFETNLNLMRNFDKGFYSGKIEFFDIVNCEVEGAPYSITDSYSKWNKLGGQDDLPKIYKDVLSKSPTRIMAVSYNDDLFLESNKESTKNRMYFKETIAQSVSRFGVFTSQILNASVYGNLVLNVGDIINIEMMDSDLKKDKTFSGKYILFGLRHIFSRGTPEGEFRTNMILVRDSFGA